MKQSAFVRNSYNISLPASVERPRKIQYPILKDKTLQACDVHLDSDVAAKIPIKYISAINDPRFKDKIIYECQIKQSLKLIFQFGNVII